MKRLLVVSVVGWMVVAAPAAAKMPPYEATVTADGDTATVTVVFEGYDMGVPELDGVLGLYTAEVFEGARGSLQGIPFTPIQLVRIADFTYEASFEIPHPGEWAIVGSPGSDEPLEEMYPTVIFSASWPIAETETTVATVTPAAVEPNVGEKSQPTATEVSKPANAAEEGLAVGSAATAGSSSNSTALPRLLGLGALSFGGAWLVRRRRATP